MAHPDLASLERRLLDRGFTTARALTLRELRRDYVERRELRRLSQLELLDEVEELELVLDHYAISWSVMVPSGWARCEGGGSGGGGGGGGDGIDTWGLVAKDQLEDDDDVEDGDDGRL